MNVVISKLLTSLLSEKILKAVLLKLGDYFIKKIISSRSQTIN
jgi:hypothetical protein